MYDSSLGLQAKRLMLKDLQHQAASRDEQILTTMNYVRQMDADLGLFEEEQKDRMQVDEMLWDEQRAYAREKEVHNADAYMDAIEQELLKVERERNQVRDFMKYIINIDHHHGTAASCRHGQRQSQRQQRRHRLHGQDGPEQRDRRVPAQKKTEREKPEQQVQPGSHRPRRGTTT